MLQNMESALTMSKGWVHLGDAKEKQRRFVWLSPVNAAFMFSAVLEALSDIR